MFEAIVESILQPGVNSQLLTAINIAFVCLLVVLTFLLVTFGFNIHLLMLIIISSGLLLSINWWVKLETDIYWAPLLAVYELIWYLYKHELNPLRCYNVMDLIQDLIRLISLTVCFEGENIAKAKEKEKSYTMTCLENCSFMCTSSSFPQNNQEKIWG